MKIYDGTDQLINTRFTLTCVCRAPKISNLSKFEPVGHLEIAIVLVTGIRDIKPPWLVTL